jgi:GTP-binding protein
MRAAAADTFEKLVPPIDLSLEQALEQITDDECVEITPDRVRLRKVQLDQTRRARHAKQAKTARSA